MVTAPRFVVAAPASGCGKTTVACGLMAAFRARGLAVSGHKVGPDYIDPGYHALATGRPGRNLDPFLCGEHLVAPLFLHGAAGADVAVVEGVLGLFDGVTPETLAVLARDRASNGDRAGNGDGDADGKASDHRRPNAGFGSTAHVAALLDAPVVLAVDAAAAGRSVAALVTGFARFDPATNVAGVILNRVGSDRHEHLLRAALASVGMTVFGAIRRHDPVAVPARHLGLVPVQERAAAAAAAVEALSALVAEHCDLDGLLALARSAPALPGPRWEPAAVVAGGLSGRARPQRSTDAARPVVAVARGPAFTFNYPEHAELLAAAGVEVAEFDPLRDERLPDRTAALMLGGGFPEVHAAELSGNDRLRREVAALAVGGAPVVAECGGLLYLSAALDGFPMCGALDVTASMTDRLTLGYRVVRAAADSVVARRGEAVRGHEFHRTVAVPESGRSPAWRREMPRSTQRERRGHRDEGHVVGSVVASYLHVHWAGHPVAAARFAAATRAASPRLDSGDGRSQGRAAPCPGA